MKELVIKGHKVTFYENESEVPETQETITDKGECDRPCTTQDIDIFFGESTIKMAHKWVLDVDGYRVLIFVEPKIPIMKFSWVRMHIGSGDCPESILADLREFLCYIHNDYAIRHATSYSDTATMRMAYDDKVYLVESFDGVWIDPTTIPEGKHVYYARHADDICYPRTIATKGNCPVVNFWGTFVCDEPIDVTGKGYRKAYRDERPIVWFQCE